MDLKKESSTVLKKESSRVLKKESSTGLGDQRRSKGASERPGKKPMFLKFDNSEKDEELTSSAAILRVIADRAATRAVRASYEQSLTPETSSIALPTTK
jgi:hypothetical protein